MPLQTYKASLHVKTEISSSVSRLSGINLSLFFPLSSILLLSSSTLYLLLFLLSYPPIASPFLLPLSI